MGVPDSVTGLVLVVVAYLTGSLASAVIVCRILGLPDPRTGGSGNPGATNVLRLGGRKAAAITLAGDVAKGLLPVLAARALALPLPVQALVGLAAFLGHLYPVFFGFKGGKGVATALGALLGLSWALGGAVLATWLAVAALTRYSSLSALVAALLAPLWGWLLLPAPDGEARGAATAVLAVMSVLLWWRHRANIGRLVRGEEDRIGHKGARAAPEAPEDA